MLPKSWSTQVHSVLSLSLSVPPTAFLADGMVKRSKVRVSNDGRCPEVK